MTWRFSIITTATDRVKWILKTMFELMLTKPNLNLVNNLTPLRLWQLKFKSVFLKIFKLSELQIFMSSLFHLITAEGKKEFWKKLCFTLNRGILLEFLVLYVLTKVGIILNKYFGQLYLKISKKATKFPVPYFSLRVSKPSWSYSLSLNVPRIALVIANAACIE